MLGFSGIIRTRAGVITSAGDGLQIRMFGRGAHGSMPHVSIEAVVIAVAFRNFFPSGHVKDTQRTTAGEDFGSFGTGWQVPSVFRFVGGSDPEIYAKAKKSGTVADLPTDHNP